MTDVEAQYGRGGLRGRIEAALAAAGKGGGDGQGPLDPDDLAAMEEFHVLGRPATIELAELAGISEGDEVLDVGSGIGGPARLLAHRYGARVTGVDLTPEFRDVAQWLSERTGLGEPATTFLTADALELPLDDASFDVVWTQHAAMNIADKAGLYREMRRVVRPGGRLAFYDLLAGPVQPLHFPVPWADTPALSHLEVPGAVRELVEAAGFRVVEWRDLTERAAKFFRERPGPEGGPTSQAATLHAVVPDLREKAMNLTRSFEEDRVRAIQALAIAE